MRSYGRRRGCEVTLSTIRPTASLELRLIVEARARHGHACIGQDGIPTCRCVIANLVDVI